MSIGDCQSLWVCDVNTLLIDRQYDLAEIHSRQQLEANTEADAENYPSRNDARMRSNRRVIGCDRFDEFEGQIPKNSGSAKQREILRAFAKFDFMAGEVNILTTHCGMFSAKPKNLDRLKSKKLASGSRACREVSRSMAMSVRWSVAPGHRRPVCGARLSHPATFTGRRFLLPTNRKGTACACIATPITSSICSSAWRPPSHCSRLVCCTHWLRHVVALAATLKVEASTTVAESRRSRPRSGLPAREMNQAKETRFAAQMQAIKEASGRISKGPTSS